jgi:hypothetical protein
MILINRFYGNEKTLPDSIALKYFFDNKVENMQGEFEGYNVDDNTYTYTSYIKKVCPLYKKQDKNIYLLCYGIDNIVYLSIYNIKTDKIESTFIVVNDSDEADVYTRSTIFSNGYIVTIQSNEKGFYILTKTDCSARKFIEIKKIEFDMNQSYDNIQKKVFEILEISEKGELKNVDE